MLLLLLAAVVCLSITLGSHPLFDPDEGRNGEVSRSMAATNDYVVPRLNGLPYLDKPILYFAAGAGFMELFGATAAAARAPSLVLALATCVLAWWFGNRVFGPSAGWIAAVATAAAPLMVAFSRIVIFDTMLTFFICVAMVAFYVRVEEGGGRWTLLAWASMALGVLTKGPIAILLPLLVAIPFAIWRRRFRALWSLPALSCFAVLLAPWLIAVSMKAPGFLHYALVTETLKRVSTDELRRTGPLWYFVPYLLVGAFPWTIAAIAGARPPLRASGSRELDPRTVFLMLWILLPFIFFSLSQSKRPQYILPVVPAVALLVGGSWGHDWRRKLPGARATGVVVTLLGSLLLLLPAIPDLRVHMRPQQVGPALFAAISLGLLLTAGGLSVWAMPHRRLMVLVALSLPILAIPIALQKTMTELGRTRSSQALAERIAPLLGGSGRVIGIGAYSPSLSFYLGRDIPLASESGAELTSNYLIRQYPLIVRKDNTTLHRKAWGQSRIEMCEAGTVFLTRTRDRQLRQSIATRLPLIADDGGQALYGPCRPVIAAPLEESH